MSSYYLDASALVKRYVNEAGSEWLRLSLSVDASPLLFTSRMSIVEVMSAFARRLRDGSLSADDLSVVRDAFRGDTLNQYQVMPPTMQVVDRACRILERYPLRAYDAVHLASALEADEFLRQQGHESLTFFSADDSLNAAAIAAGLLVENPNDHRM